MTNDLHVNASCILAFPSQKLDISSIIDAIEEDQNRWSSSVSLWLWVKEQYNGGSLTGNHWKIALHLRKHGWVVRNEVIWVCKAFDPVPNNRLKRCHETLLHLTRGHAYYYDKTMGAGINQTHLKKSGMVGLKYIKQIENSPFMTADEKLSARHALTDVITKIANGEISDFRMMLRGIHKVTKSVSGQVDKYGFFIRTSVSHQSFIDDLWTAFANNSNAVIPDDALLTILKLSCPPGQPVFDMYPSPQVCDIVLSSGRPYIAKGIGNPHDAPAELNNVLPTNIFSNIEAPVYT